MATALNLISYRARTKAELSTQLKRRLVPPEQIEATVTRLTELGYLNDEQFAKDRASALLRSGRFGPRAIQQKLRIHGLPEGQAKQALSEMEQALEFNPLETARKLLAKRGLTRPADQKARARAVRLLVSRGFTGSVIARALDARELESVLDDS
jgi:regulatory protein